MKTKWINKAVCVATIIVTTGSMIAGGIDAAAKTKTAQITSNVKKKQEKATKTTKNVPEPDWNAMGWKADPTDLEWKEDTSAVKLKYYVNFSWFGLDWKDAAAKKVTDKTGVDLELTKPVSDDNQKLNMMVSGNQLPDIMTLDRKDPALQTMIDSDMLWSLDDLMEKYAPKMKDILPEETMQNYQSKDGKTYRLTTWIEGKQWQASAKKYNQIVGVNQPVWSIRKDYYDEIGRPEIKNIDDYIDVLTEIHKKHPDKIGFYPGDGALLDIGKNPGLGEVGAQFGLSTSQVDIDGQMKWVVRDKKYKDAIFSLNKLYKKGLLTKDPFIDSKDVARSKIDKGDVISYSWTIGDGEKVPSDNPKTQYEILPPFDTYEQDRSGAGWMATVIPKTCKHPERAIRFLEYMASAEGHKDVSWGNYGEDYNGDVANGAQYHLVDGRPTYLKDYYKDKNADWEGVASKNGLGEYWFACNQLLWDMPQWDTTNEKMNKYNDEFGSKVVYKPALDVNDPLPTDKKGIILQKAQDVLKQDFVKMVTSDNPKTEYKTFIKKIDKLGMKKVEKFWDKEYRANIKAEKK